MSESSQENTKLALVTCPPDEAQGIAESLVSERLAACVNIVPQVGSVYRWQGKVESGSESMLVIKTTASRIEELCERVVELHSYSCPEVIALEVSDGYLPYLNWIVESTSVEETSD
jgi:periplasmic divalent cation tolerance protein